MTKRIWKPVKGYDGWYEISNTGHVRSWKNRGRYGTRKIIPKILKTPLWDKYKVIRLTKNNNTETHLVHRLVAEAFIPNPESKPQVNHINETKTDNRAENLEWVTARENAMHSFNRNNFMPTYNAKLVPDDVREIRRLRRESDLTQKEIAERFPVGVQSIRKVLDGRSWSHID